MKELFGFYEVGRALTRIMNTLSERTICCLIAIINFLLIFFWCFYKSGLLYVFWNYAFHQEYRSVFSYEMHGLVPGVSLFTVMKTLFLEHNWEFDYYLSESSVLFSVTLPLTSSVAGILFNHRSKSVYEYAVYRAKSRKRFYLSEAVKSSTMVSLCFFIPMMLQYIILYFTARGHMYGEVGAHLLLDLLGSSYYYAHPYLYWFMNIALRFLLCPFCYAMMACGFGLVCSSAKETVWFSNIYYYGLMLTGMAFLKGPEVISLYLNPYILLADGGSFWYVNYNTVWMLLTGAGLPLLAGIFIILFFDGCRSL